MKNIGLLKKMTSQALYYYYKLSGIANKKVMVKSVKSEVSFNHISLPQREFSALSKSGKVMASGKVMLGRFQEYKYHYCILNGTIVLPLYRRRKLASKLVKARILFCRKEGFEVLIVAVEASNTPSLKMLSACGFTFPDKEQWTPWMYKEAQLYKEQDILIGQIILRDVK
ncbi:GNAT family N-acetyltransferase [Carboxylicivirga marina]|uniref:GNAT family N-acetyltransferase n=1 Tax=Carboxylicivirga marina TaxID=2800988 RepID=A0ABS1HJZ4_9BACT|nr:GNAT family N-acetyltransferase [Carboxylicivirga marina]MBK3517997.1 GNAT family N-acetyltransferase [Carboxylicivirga marina]